MQAVTITQITPPELETLIENTLRKILLFQNPEQLAEIIDRGELCKRLAITEPTAIRWEKKGKIPCFRIGSSVRYNWQIVIDTLEKKEGSK